jgi:radical SAM protein with 4Fe4S-binding SPASM domain
MKPGEIMTSEGKFFFLNRECYYEMGVANGAIYNLYTGDVFSIEAPLADILDLLEHKGLSIREAIHAGQYSKNIDENILFERLQQLESLDLGEFYPKRIYVEKIKPKNTKKNRLTEGTSLQLDMVWLKISNSCNLHCIHCCEPDGSIAKCGCSINNVRPEDFLNLDELKKILDDAKLFNCREIRFIGGEPLLRKNDLISLVKYAKQIDIPSLSLVTNGFLLDSTIIDEMAEYNIHFKLLFNSHEESIHDSISGVTGSYQKTLAAIKRLKIKNCPIAVNIIISKQNQGDINATIGFLKELGIENIDVQILRTVREDVLASEMKTGLYRTTPLFPKVFKDQFFISKESSPCWLGKVSIDLNGDVFPCLMNYKEFLGNVKEMPLANIVRKSPLVEKYWYHTKNEVDTCRNCEFRYACVDCRLSDCIGGNLAGRNKYCEYHPDTGEWISQGQSIKN